MLLSSLFRSLTSLPIWRAQKLSLAYLGCEGAFISEVLSICTMSISRSKNKTEPWAFSTYLIAASICGSRRETQLLLKSRMNSGRLMSTSLFYGQLISNTEYVYDINQLRQSILMSIRALLNTPLKALFARCRPTKITIKNQEKEKEKSLDQIIKEINYQNFDFYLGLPQIDYLKQDKEISWLKQLRKVYQDNNIECLDQLRMIQENITHKIHEVELIQYEMPKIFNLKISFSAKFRNWDEVVVDTENSIKYTVFEQIEGSQNTYLRLMNQQCVAFLMSDHERLYKLLHAKNPPTNSPPAMKQTGRSKGKFPKSNVIVKTPKQISLQFFQKAKAMARQITANQNFYKACFDTVVLQAISFLAIGDKKTALLYLSKLTGNNFTLKMRQQAFILIVTALAFQKSPKTSVQGLLYNKLKNMNAITDEQSQTLSELGLNPAQAQYILNSICKRVNKIPIQKIQQQIIYIPYSRAIFLISQCYYLINKLEDSQRLLNIHSKFCSVKQLNMMLQYLTIGAALDQYQINQAIEIFEQYKEQQTNEEGDAPNPSFYTYQTINNDHLRVQIYRMKVNICRQLGKNELEEEAEDQLQAMETAILYYALRQPHLHEELRQHIDDWRYHADARMPVYYFNLKLHQKFEPNWFQDYSSCI